jgi:hypothetical protein
MHTISRDWTVKEDKILSYLYIFKKLRISEIADILNRTVGSISNRRNILHLCRNHIPNPVDKVLENRIRELHSKGLNNVAIASAIKMHRRTIESHLYRMGLRSNLNLSARVPLSNGTTATCSRCFTTKSISEFFIGRKGKSDSYRYSYCKTCRELRTRYLMNNNIESYLGYRIKQLGKRVRRKNDARFGVEFNLTKEFVVNMYSAQKGKCFYTGQPLICRYGEGHDDNTLSFDRIIPGKGYVMDNVVLCSTKINTVKNKLSLDELKKWIPKWYIKIKKHLASLDVQIV